MSKDRVDEIKGWLAGRVSDDWFSEPLEVSVDRDEILVVGTLAGPSLPGDATDESRKVAERARIDSFRDETREKRITIASEAEAKFERKVSWGARCGELGLLFAHLSIPAMTRLRLKERLVLDTLVQSGVARSRSDALAWCVRLVGHHEKEWLGELRDAMVAVDEVRERGPEA